MKKIRSYIAVAFLASAYCGLAQGTFQYTADINGGNVVPRTGSMNSATGTFSLEGQTLSFGIVWNSSFLFNSVEIHGPAGPGENALSLHLLVGNPGPPHPLFIGSIQISPSETTDLNAGLWYVLVRTPDFPNGEIRGQITPVPEPSVIVLLSLAFVGLGFARRKSRNEGLSPTRQTG
jgi:hypothetical protein